MCLFWLVSWLRLRYVWRRWTLSCVDRAFITINPLNYAHFIKWWMEIGQDRVAENMFILFIGQPWSKAFPLFARIKPHSALLRYARVWQNIRMQWMLWIMARCQYSSLTGLGLNDYNDMLYAFMRHAFWPNFPPKIRYVVGLGCRIVRVESSQNRPSLHFC